MSPAWQKWRKSRLELIHNYILVKAKDDRGPWKVSTAGWNYEITDDRDVPIIEFHWHPGSGRVGWPHTHAHGVHETVHMHKLHPPTGRVSIESVVRFLIEDLGVIPLKVVDPNARRPTQGWQEILEAREAVFRQWRTWN